MQFGLIGEKLGHTFSPEIHRDFGDYSYAVQEIPPDKVAEFMQKRDFDGINVTVPYKKAVMPFIEHLDDAARQIGAVNTVIRRGDDLWGYNTDHIGLRATFSCFGIEIRGKKILIYGTGGTAATARYTAEKMGADSVLCVSRTPTGDAISYDEARLLNDTDVIINATPVGMYPHSLETPLSVRDFPHCQAVVDAVYHPLRTRLLTDAAEAGMCAVGGLYMLVAQAAEAATLFTGRKIEEETVAAVYRRLYLSKENIVLIGMPGCGKSTVGSLLAAKMGRQLMDTDQEIETITGRRIPEIFALEGEGSFRNIEKQVIADIFRRTGTVIATGGGAVLDPENVRLLRQNGTLIWLDRPLDELALSDGRPLAPDRAALERLYTQRYALYQMAADYTVRERTPEECVDRILEYRNGREV